MLTYRVTGTTANGCSATKTITIGGNNQAQSVIVNNTTSQAANGEVRFRFSLCNSGASQNNVAVREDLPTLPPGYSWQFSNTGSLAQSGNSLIGTVNLPAGTVANPACVQFGATATLLADASVSCTTQALTLTDVAIATNQCGPFSDDVTFVAVPSTVIGNGQARVTLSSLIASTVFPTNITSGMRFVLAASLDVDVPYVFTNCTLTFAPGREMRIKQGINVQTIGAHFNSDCDNNLWQGIVVEQSARLDCKSMTVNDALIGVNILDLSIVALDFAEFYNNFIGVYISEAFGDLGTINLSNSVVQFGREMRYETTRPQLFSANGAALLANHNSGYLSSLTFNNARGFCGILSPNAPAAMYISFSRFRNLFNGVICDGSAGLSFFQTSFNTIPQGPRGGNPSGNAVLVSRSKLSMKSSYSGMSTFEGVHIGVNGTDLRVCDIDGISSINLLTSPNNHGVIVNNSHLSTVLIRNCNLRQLATGIAVRNATGCLIDILDNNITVGTASTVSSGRVLAAVAIDLNSVSNGVDFPFSIQGNTINLVNEAVGGISLNDLRVADVTGNTINHTDPLGTHQYGIRLDACEDSRIACNLVHRNTAVGNYTLDTRELPSGVYYVKISQSEGNLLETLKLMVVR